MNNHETAMYRKLLKLNILMASNRLSFHGKKVAYKMMADIILNDGRNLSMEITELKKQRR